MSKHVVLITGGNTGLGYEIVKALIQNGDYEIIISARSAQKANSAIAKLKSEVPSSTSTLSSVSIDIESDESIQSAFEELSVKYSKIDTLINNAGAAFDQCIQDGSMTVREAWNKAWNVNTSGTHIMTSTFVPLLLASSSPRLIFITSGTSPLSETMIESARINKAPPKGWPKPSEWGIISYRASKTGMNMMMRDWCRVLREDGVKVFAVSPGFLATGLGDDTELLKKLGALDPAIGGNFVKDVVQGKRDADAGKAIRKDSVQPW